MFIYKMCLTAIKLYKHRSELVNIGTHHLASLMTFVIYHLKLVHKLVKRQSFTNLRKISFDCLDNFF